MVIDIGRSAGPRQGPELEEAVIDNIEGLGFVAEVVFAMPFRGLLGLGSAFLGCIGVVPRLVGGGIILIPNSG